MSLSIAKLGDAGSAFEYYSEADDYYMSDHSPAEWHGAGAAALGLTGDVDPSTFHDVLEELASCRRRQRTQVQRCPICTTQTRCLTTCGERITNWTRPWMPPIATVAAGRMPPALPSCSGCTTNLSRACCPRRGHAHDADGGSGARSVQS